MEPVKYCMVLITAFAHLNTCDTTRLYNDEYSRPQISSEKNVNVDKEKPSGWVDPFKMGLEPMVKKADDKKLKTLSQQYPYDIVPPRPGWVDPFNMLGEPSHSSDLLVLGDVEKHILTKRLTNCEFFAKRFTNLFYNALFKSKTFQDSSQTYFESINLEFEITSEDMKTLYDFGHSPDDGNLEQLEEVSKTLTKLFQNSKSVKKGSCSNIWGILPLIENNWSRLAQSPEWSVFSGVFLLLFLTLWAAWNHSYKFAIFTMFLTIFLCGFGFTWIRMIEEKEIERLAKLEQHGTAPYHCKHNDMRWFQHIYYRMFGEDCMQFYKVMDVRLMVKVSPTDAFAETLSSMITGPSKNIGYAYANFISSITDAVPWYLKGVAIVLGSLLPAIFLMVLLTFLFGYNLSLSLTGFHIYPSWFNRRVPNLSDPNEKYVEDISLKGVERKISYEAVMNNSDEAVFMMNWKGMQKLASRTLLNEDEDNNKEKLPSRTKDEPHIKMIDQKPKASHSEENCRKRSGNVSSGIDKTDDNIESLNESDSNLENQSENQLVSMRVRKSTDALNKEEIKEKQT